MACPHCESKSVVRTSQFHSVLLRESYHICQNPLCGHTFSCYTEVIRTLSPSAMPNPAINLPIARGCDLHKAMAAFKAQSKP